jgi:putative intracellular protease/amidase
MTSIAFDSRLISRYLTCQVSYYMLRLKIQRSNIMKHLLFACGYLLCAVVIHAEVVTVDGVGVPPHFSSISDAIAALSRNDGSADTINVAASTIQQATSISIDFTGGNTDALTINGDADGNGSCVVVFFDSIGVYAIEAYQVSGVSLTIRDLVMIPQFAGTGVNDFEHAALFLDDDVPGSDTGSPLIGNRVSVENVVVTASLNGNIPADPDQLIYKYIDYTRWNGADAPAYFSGARTTSTAVGSSDYLISMTGFKVAHAAASGFNLRHDSGARMTLRDCSAKYCVRQGLYTYYMNGDMRLENCELSHNAQHGYYHYDGGGSLELIDCTVNHNAVSGLRLGGTSSANIPDTTISGGSFCDNGTEHINSGIWIYGNGGSLDMRGSADDPILLLENYTHGIRFENDTLQLSRVEYTLFAGHRRSGARLSSLNLSSSPVFEHCAFSNNGYDTADHHAQFSLNVANTAAATLTFNDCTFFNVNHDGYDHIVIDSVGTWNVTLDINRCIFAGGPSGAGNDERALYLDGTNCSAVCEDSAFVTAGPYALNASYTVSNIAGSGNLITQLRCINADANFAPSRYFKRQPELVAANGSFMQVRSDTYKAVGIGGYNNYPIGYVSPTVPLRVAIYVDSGASTNSKFNTDRIPQGCTDLHVERLMASDIQTGALDNYDVVVFPGGGASTQFNALGSGGQANVKAFVANGGGFVGFCAGAYLARSLGILDANLIDSSHWARGHGMVDMEMTRQGQRLLDESRKVVDIMYWQGPLLAPKGDPSIPDYVSLATFKTEMHDNGATVGAMIGTDAIVVCEYAQGRVFACSPHPEHQDSPPGLEEYFYRAIYWTAGRLPGLGSSRQLDVFKMGKVWNETSYVGQSDLVIDGTVDALDLLKLIQYWR